MNPKKLIYHLKKKDSPFAIIIGSDCVTGLQTARVLKQKKIPVIGIATNRKHPCCYSRTYDKLFFADTSIMECIDLLESLGPMLTKKGVLVPCTDMSVLLVSRNRHRIAKWYHVVLPDEETVEMLTNKAKFYTFAQKEGLPVPKTFFVHNRTDAINAARQLRFPCVLKPPLKTPEWDKNLEQKVYKVDNLNELVEIYDRASKWITEMIIQEWIDGPDSNLFTCNTYFHSDSIPLVTFVSRKLRQWPPEAGLGSISDEVRIDEVTEETVRLFRRVSFYGLGYIEFKLDRRNGRYYIIEPNTGRPTGRSTMAEACGVELHYTMYCDAIGRPLPENREQRFTGVKWIHLRHDLQACWGYWRRGDLTLGEILKSWKGPKTYAYLSLKDPLPFLEDIRQKLWKLFSRKKTADAKESYQITRPSVPEVTI